MIRILHVITTLDARSGGPSEAVRQLCVEFDRTGIAKLEVVTLDAVHSPWLNGFPCDIHALGPGVGTYHFTPGLVRWLKVNARNYDCVVMNGIWQYGSFAVWRALRNGPVPYFVFTHGMLDPWFKWQYPLKHLKKSLYWPWAEYRVLRDARAVMFTCEEERRLARQSFWLYKANECVINYGTAPPQGDPDKQREIYLSEFPELRGKRVFLFLSRIHEKKGCDLLIKAFGRHFSQRSKVATSGTSTDNSQPATDDLRLVIAGPCAKPAYLEMLKKLATDHCPSNTVSFPGMLSGDLKWGAFHAAEAFVLPSHQENFGIAVAEALACALPVLISDKVNIWREIKADGGGIVASDSLQGAHTLFDRWLRMEANQRKTMRDSAKACFDQRFEIGRAAQSVYEALSKSVRNQKLDVGA